MDELTAFLGARLDEDEATAKHAAGCALVQRDGYEAGDWSWLRSHGQPQPDQIALIDHQSRFDPARVLREVEAGRKLLALLGQDVADGRERDYEATEMLEQVARIRAAVWSDHPDYRPGWKP